MCHPENDLVGGGLFAHFSVAPSRLAWEAFGEKNGAPTYEAMRTRIERYRRKPSSPHEKYEIGCILLTQPFFFERSDWIPAPPDETRRDADEALVRIAPAEAPRQARAPLDAAFGFEVGGHPRGGASGREILEGDGGGRNARGKRRLARRGRTEDSDSLCRLSVKDPWMGFEVQLIMRVATGRVIDGKVVVEGEPLVEGSTVTVFLPEPDEEIELTPEEESRLAQVVREADQGDFIEEDAERFLDELDRQS